MTNSNQSMCGGDPDALDRLADKANHGSAAILAIRVIAEGIAAESPLLGDLGRRMVAEFEGQLLPQLRQAEDALTRVADVLTWHAQEQRHASDSTARPPAGPRPAYETPPLESGSGGVLNTVVGGLQIAGGTIEAGVGGLVAAAGWVAPEPVVTKVLGTALGGALIVHGSDTVAAGYRTLRDGKPHDTYTHQLAEAAARKAGVPERGSWWIGFGVDLLAGIGPAAGASLIRGAAPEVASQTDALLLATNQRGAGSSTWHSMVGVRIDGVEQWGDLLRDRQSGLLQWSFRPMANAERLQGPAFGMWVREIPAEPDKAATALQAMRGLDERFGRDSLIPRVPWSRTGTNCSTAACEVLTSGGLDLPWWAGKHPALLHLSLHPGLPPAEGVAAVTGQVGASGGNLLGNGSLDPTAGDARTPGK
ncbi:hypothetical protein KIPE111705_39590 [Kibdelosporangium persicum]|uniref:Uncharacterized protein n=1 Tax=Kibdelosporangium persicum TaxID=2698649 RepID=A0ABX2FBN2_9PSEU|nr:hypothetical protein [Kibdelosporangium persicum]NRN68742.1 hypothetical protein [Kibdelosporangium persicum]